MCSGLLGMYCTSGDVCLFSFNRNSVRITVRIIFCARAREIENTAFIYTKVVIQAGKLIHQERLISENLEDKHGKGFTVLQKKFLERED